MASEKVNGINSDLIDPGQVFGNHGNPHVEATAMVIKEDLPVTVEETALPLRQFMNDYRPYKEKREFVRELRMAAFRTATVPPRPSRPPPTSPYETQGEQHQNGVDFEEMGLRPGSPYDLPLENFHDHDYELAQAKLKLKAELTTMSTASLQNANRDTKGSPNERKPVRTPEPTQLDEFSSNRGIGYSISVGMTQLDSFSTSPSLIRSTQLDEYTSSPTLAQITQLDSFLSSPTGDVASTQLGSFEKDKNGTVETYNHTVIVQKAEGLVHHHHHHHHHHYYGEPDALNAVPELSDIKVEQVDFKEKNEDEHDMDDADMLSCISRNTRRSRSASYVLETISKEREHIHTHKVEEDPEHTEEDDDDSQDDEDDIHVPRYVGLSIDGQEDQDIEEADETAILSPDLKGIDSVAETSSLSESSSLSARQSRTQSLMAMLEQADAAIESCNKNNEEQTPASLSLMSFGERLQAARMIRSERVKGSTRLPQYASQREENPSRPPPVISDAATGTTRTYRSKSDGDSITFDGKAIHKEGYLLKSPPKSRLALKKQNKWRSRYFKLSGRILMYMQSKDSSLPKGMIDLQNIEIVTDAEEIGETPTPHAMLVYDRSSGFVNRNTFRICAETYSEILAWYRAIIMNTMLLSAEKQHNESGAMDMNGGDTNDGVNSTVHPLSYGVLPPQDRTPLTKQELHMRELSKLPKPKALKRTSFYPLYRKPPTHYDMLDIPPDASNIQIKKSFRSLAREFHPDRNPDADPKEFAAISHAYDVLIDEELRQKYDLGEKVKDVLRRGFDATLYIPLEMEYNEETNKSYPSQLEAQQLTIFCDGELNMIFYQPVSPVVENEPLHPNVDSSFELRYVQRVIFGRNDLVMSTAFGSPPLEQETRMVLVGSKLSHDIYIEFDTPESCRQMLEGLRIIRCEKSMLFSQNLEKWKSRGFD